MKSHYTIQDYQLQPKNTLTSTDQIINYISRDLDSEDINLTNFSTLLGTATLFGMISAVMYYPGGIELAKLWSKNLPSQIAAEIAFVVGGVGSNACLNSKIFYDLIKEILALAETPEELKELISTQHSPTKRFFIGALATLVGAISLMPTVAFVFGTNSHGGKVNLTGLAWFDFITSLASNLVLNIRSILAMSKEDNPLYLKSLSQLTNELWIKATKSDIELNRFYKKIKLDYVERKIYKAIFNNFCQMWKSNYENKNLGVLLRDFTYNKIEKKSDTHKFIKTGIGLSFCGLNMFSLIGYFVGTYLILKSWFPNDIASSIITAITNFFFVYLVMKFTNSVSIQLFDMLVNLVSRGYTDYKNDFPNWFHAREKTSLILFSIFISMTLFSFASGVDLFYQNFNNTREISTELYFNNASEHSNYGIIIPGIISNIMSSCIFNGSGIPDIMELFCLFTLLVKSKFNSTSNENQKLVNQDYEAKAIRDEKISRIIVQLRRLPEKTFLNSILNFIEEQVNVDILGKDSQIKQLSSEKIVSMDEFKSFIEKGITPNHYKEKSPTYYGRFFNQVPRNVSTSNNHTTSASDGVLYEPTYSVV